MIAFDRIQLVTFDCYGTLVDWETGILAALQPALSRRGVRLEDRELLETYARLESQAETGRYTPYRDVLGRVVKGFARELGFSLEPDDWGLISDTIADWPPFEDTVEALQRLKSRFRVAVISNVDDELFEGTRARLGVAFDDVITAEQARAYKPDLEPFTLAEQRLGVPRHRWLHAAQSLYHDIEPARRLGIPTARVHRRRGRSGFGATPPAASVPDLEVGSVAELADLALAS